MRESTKSVKGDHRTVSDPIKERKEFVEHLRHNAPVDESKITPEKPEKPSGGKR